MSTPVPRFAVGAGVRVADRWPERCGRVHVRTPHYLRGCFGRVVRVLGRFPNPEDLAFSRPAAPVVLYHVAVAPVRLWPEAEGADELLVELYEHWLESADAVD